MQQVPEREFQKRNLYISRFLLLLLFSMLDLQCSERGLQVVDEAQIPGGSEEL